MVGLLVEDGRRRHRRRGRFRILGDVRPTPDEKLARRNADPLTLVQVGRHDVARVRPWAKPSPWCAARTAARRVDPPISSGGPGRCAGLGVTPRRLPQGRRTRSGR